MKKLLYMLLLSAVSFTALSQQRVAQYKSKEDKLNEEYCTGLFKTDHGTYFDMLNDDVALSARSYINVLDWLQGRVAGLQIYTGRNNTMIPFIRGSRAGIYVDEMWRDADFLNVLPVTDIAMIKIIKGPFAGGFDSPGGVVAIYTIRGDEEE
ncbi:MAG: TonB-dependent receptor plug domain-containing protein [Chitinophagaceae bacterium]|nr:TonB-dependent receptor plug domain-containing protein [Chitinophagaceae bacterium]